MTMPVFICSIIAFLCIISVMYGIFRLSPPCVVIGFMALLFNGFVGFGAICCDVIRYSIPPIYSQSESVFQDEKYMTAILDGKAYVVEDARTLIKAKDGLVKIKISKWKNAYNRIRFTEQSICVFTPEEWKRVEDSIRQEQ